MLSPLYFHFDFLTAANASIRLIIKCQNPILNLLLLVTELPHTQHTRTRAPYRAGGHCDLVPRDGKRRH